MPNPYVSPLLVDIADGAQILNTTTETIMCPDYAFSVNDPRIYQGAMFNIRSWFEVSNVVTTPGNLTIRVRWGGVAGTVLASTGAVTLSSTARTSYSGSVDIDLVVRSIGSSGSIFCQGRCFLNDVPVAADSAPQGIYTMGSAGANVPAVVSGINFTTGTQSISLTAQFSVSTATTQLTNHIRVLKAYSS